MKTLKLFLSLLFCILLCVSFTRNVGSKEDSLMVQKRESLAVSGKEKTFTVKGKYYIDSSIKGVYFKCDSTAKIIIRGKHVVIEDCVFDANGHSVDRSLIEFLGENVVFKNCLVENIKGVDGNGGYGIFVDIERCSSHIQDCTFKNISDEREETEPFGYMKGMCGGIFYSGMSYYLKSKPLPQFAENVVFENIYTSLVDGNINHKSNDADGIRIFINEHKTSKELLNAQKYVFRNIVGRDLQKRLVKISGATNCSILGVTYTKNRNLDKRYPAHLIAVFDSDSICISDVDYDSGCNDIFFCASNSTNVTLDGAKVRGNGTLFNRSTSSLFRIDRCRNLEIKSLSFEGKFQRLGELYTSENVDIQVKGEKYSCINPIVIKDIKNLIIRGRLNSPSRGVTDVVRCVNVEELTVEEQLYKKSSELFVLENCSEIKTVN